MKAWDEAKDLEIERIRSLKVLYEDIAKHNQKIFGQSQQHITLLQEMNKTDHMKVVNELYSFKGLISESELKALMQLNE